MKLLELCLSPNFGGLEIYFKDICIWFAQRNNIDLYIATSNNSPLQQSLNSAPASQLTLSYRFSSLPLFAARSLSRFIENNNIDAVHLHWKHDLPLVSLTKKICRRQFALIHTRHMDLPGGKHDIYHKFIYKEIDKFISITDYLKKQAQRNTPLHIDKICRIYCGSNPTTPLTTANIQALKLKFHIDNKFTIGVAGRIEPQKGQHLLIKAIDGLSKEGLDLYGVVIGDAMSNDYMNEIKDLISARSLQDRIILVPFQADLTKIIQCLDILVLATAKETFGMVLVEGMRAGISVIGSNAGGVPEIIDHNKTGLLFDSENVGSLSEAIKTLYFNRELKGRLADAGQKKAEASFNKLTLFEDVSAELFKTLNSM